MFFIGSDAKQRHHTLSWMYRNWYYLYLLAFEYHMIICQKNLTMFPRKFFLWLELKGEKMITSKSYYTMKRQWIISSHLHEQRHSESDLNDVYKRSYIVFFLIFVCIVCNVCWIKSNKCKEINLAMCIRFRKNALKDTISK